YDRRFLLAQAGDFVELPIISRVVELARGRSDHHAEHRFGAAPMDTWVAHRDAVGRLQTRAAKARRAGQVLRRAIGVADEKITAAPGGLQVCAMIAEYRRHRR